MTTEAYALRRYIKNDGSFNFRAFEKDTTNLAREAPVDKPQHERVVMTIEALWQGKVVQGRLDKQKDVLAYYASANATQLAERTVGEKFRNALLKGEVDENNQPLEWQDGEVGVWISPPQDSENDLEGSEGYKNEGRLRIVVKQTKMGIPVLLTFGIPLVDVTPEECMYEFWRIAEHTTGNQPEITKPKHLRESILRFMPEDGDWLSFFDQIVKRKFVSEETWQAIKTGEVADQSRKMFQLFKKTIITSDIREDIENAVKNNDFESLIRIGARVEKRIYDAGWDIKSGVCGILNSDQLEKITNINYDPYAQNTPDWLKFGEGEYVRSCPYCGAKIEKVIHPGYECRGKNKDGSECKQVFLGACKAGK